MSYFEESVEVVSVVGAVDITAENCSRFVVLNDDGEFVLAGADAAPYGVITTKQPAGAAGRVAFAGIVPVEAGDDIAVGDAVAVGADGVAVPADDGAGVGIARTAAAEGSVVAVHINRPVAAPAAPVGGEG